MSHLLPLLLTTSSNNQQKRPQNAKVVYLPFINAYTIIAFITLTLIVKLRDPLSTLLFHTCKTLGSLEYYFKTSI